MADFTWDDMPESLAEMLSEAVNSNGNLEFFGEEIRCWLLENIQPCKATGDPGYGFPELKCGEKPVVGSEFCTLHIPAEELDRD